MASLIFARYIFQNILLRCGDRPCSAEADDRGGTHTLHTEQMYTTAENQACQEIVQGRGHRMYAWPILRRALVHR